MRTALGEREVGKRARILAAAEQLVGKRGFKGVTIADIAEHAHVGKGTVYLYWPTKEALFLGLLSRSFLAVLDDLVAQLPNRPDLARPEQLFPQLVHGLLQQPLVRALQTSDAEVLGALIDDPRSQDMLERQGAAALIRALLPVWRRHGLARTDWDLDRQAYALQVVALGYVEASTRTSTPDALDPQAREATLADTVSTLLANEAGTAETATTTAREVHEAFEAMRATLRDSLNDEH